jgi:hypothetical protein
MKTNEIPEKIYLTTDGNNSFVFTRKRSDNEGIEYTRTDVFIKKTYEWLSNNLQTIRDDKSPSKHHVETIPVLGSITQTEFLEKFKKEITLQL